MQIISGFPQSGRSCAGDHFLLSQAGVLQVSEEATELAEREGKVAAVTKALREALIAADARQYVRPLLTSYSALGDVHGALRLIKDAKEEQLAKEGQQGHSKAVCPSDA